MKTLILYAALLSLFPWTSSVMAEQAVPRRGMWVWHFQCYATPSEKDRLIQFCKAQKINLLLVQVHYDEDPQTRFPRGIRDPKAFGDLIQQAKEAGIVVEALEGDPQWALRSGQASFWPKFDVIMNWYKSQPPSRRFAGLHLDVEPYLLDQFHTTRKWDLLRDYLEYLAEVRQRMKQQAPSLILAADIPFWYDNHPEDEYLDHNVVEFNGKKKYVSSHVQDICDYIGIMSYRRKAVGENSITKLCEGEMAYAEKIGKKIFAAVEMSPNQDPPTISFYGMDVPLFREQMDLVDKTFGGRPGYGGILIHHYLSYREFLEGGKSPTGSRADGR